MTTENIIATLKQGVPVTARLVREIIIKLERLAWAESSLNAALRKYADTAVALSLEESRWVCDALDDHERLKEAVAWLLDVDAAREWVRDECPWTSDESWDEIECTYAETKNAVRDMM